MVTCPEGCEGDCDYCEIDPRSIGPGREEIYRSTVTIPGHSDICENIIVLTVFRKTIELNKRHFKEEKK